MAELISPGGRVSRFEKYELEMEGWQADQSVPLSLQDGAV